MDDAHGGARWRNTARAEGVPPPPYSVTIGGGAPAAPPADMAAMVVARLEEAGASLLALPRSGFTTSLRQTRYDVVRDAAEVFAAVPGRLRPPVPDSAAISRMDEAFGWLGLIPRDRYVLRRIAGARALVDPVNGRHLHTWRRLGTLLGADHRAVQRWHADAIRLIVAGLASHEKLPVRRGDGRA